jgi:hypothetical protein
VPFSDQPVLSSVPRELFSGPDLNEGKIMSAHKKDHPGNLYHPRIIAAELCVLVLVTLAQAQTKVSGTSHCAKPDIQQSVNVPDHPGHALVISQSKCTWTKPMETDGIQDKDAVTTATAEVRSGKSTNHGYFVDNMANGDKVFVRFQGSGSMKDNTSEGKWTYAGGTGKFKGIKGQGTYKGKAAQDESETFDVEGEYTLPK